MPTLTTLLRNHFNLFQLKIQKRDVCRLFYLVINFGWVDLELSVQLSCMAAARLHPVKAVLGRQWDNQVSNPTCDPRIYILRPTPAGPCSMLHRRQFGYQAVRAGVHADAGQADQGGARAPQPAARHPTQEELTHRRRKSGKDPGPTTIRKIHVMVNAVCSNS